MRPSWGLLPWLVAFARNCTAEAHGCGTEATLALNAPNSFRARRFRSQLHAADARDPLRRDDEDRDRWLLIELDERLSLKAATLAIDHQLRGPDAIVLASARHANAETLVSWDQDLLKFGTVGGLEICTPDQVEVDQESLDDL